MKTRKVKFLVALVILLFAMFAFDGNNVLANDADEYWNYIYDLMPKEMNIDLSEMECDKALTIIAENIKSILSNNGLECELIRNESVYAIIRVNDERLNGVFDGHGISNGQCDILITYYPYNSQEYEIYNFHKFYISPLGALRDRKEVELIYNNINEYNTIDEEYVKNLNINDKKISTIILDSLLDNFKDDNGIKNWALIYEMYYDQLNNYYKNLFNDYNVTVTVSQLEIGEWGGSPNQEFFCIVPANYFINVFKNEILYDSIHIKLPIVISKIIIPDNVEDTMESYISYAKDIILKKYVDNKIKNITISKGAENITFDDSYIDVKNIKNIYTISFIYEDARSTETLRDYVVLEKVSNTFIKRDSITDIKLDTTTDVVPAGTELKAEEIKEGETYNKVKLSIENVVTKFVLYDITLLSGNAKIQPNGKVKISIPIPVNYDTTKLAVYRIEDDGTRINYEFTIEDNYVVIETDHFSNYVVAEKSATGIQNSEETTTTDETTNNDTITESRKKDDTPKTGNITVVIIKYAVVCIAVTGIAIIRKNKKRVK